MPEKENLSQSEIRNENTLAIFNEIVTSDGISRSEISEKTGLSLMTVGKIADKLTHEKLINQTKPATGNAGRRAGMLTFSEKNFILVLDLCTKAFRASAIDLKLNTVDSAIYEYNDSLFPEDNLTIFFRETGTLLMKHLMEKKMIGTGICVPGNYDDGNDTIINPKLRELEGIKISENMKKAIGFTPDRIMNGAEAAAISFIEHDPSQKMQCALFISIDRVISGCIAFEGKILHRTANFEALICENGLPLGRCIETIIDEEELCRQIGSALCPIISFLSPDAIYFSSGKRYFSDWFHSMLEKELKTKQCAPAIIFENSRNIRSDMGISLHLRSDMIRSL